MTDKQAATSSVLASMTAGIMARKEAKAAVLSPVGPEVREPTRVVPRRDIYAKDRDMFAPPPRHQLWMLANSLRELVKDAEAILAHLPASNAEASEPPPTPEDEASAQREIERAADEKFRAGMLAQQAAAQAQVFKLDDQPEESAGGAWACPAHGSASTEERISRKGRKYGACTQCDKWELPA